MDLLDCFQQALQAVNGRHCVRAWLTQHEIATNQQLALVAIGKAALAMTEGALGILGPQVTKGLVICKATYPEALEAPWPDIEIIASAHPVPDERSLLAGQRLIAFVQDLPEDIPVLFLISGGTSALVEVLREGMALVDLQQINTTMLASGMPIAHMNRVRQAISRIKGGGLLHYLGKRQVYNLLLSDVPGNDPAVIGSGLLVKNPGQELPPDDLPDTLKALLQKAVISNESTPYHPDVETAIIGDNQLAREAAANAARLKGYAVYDHADLLIDDVNTVAENIIQTLHESQPGIHIWGAEPTVCLPEHVGRGGRNQHLALLLANRIYHMSNIHILVVGTDGSDGETDDAGGLVDGETIERGEQEGLSAKTCIESADAGRFLEASGDLLSTGPTGSNVMDLVIACKT